MDMPRELVSRCSFRRNKGFSGRGRPDQEKAASQGPSLVLQFGELATTLRSALGVQPTAHQPTPPQDVKDEV